MNESRHPTPCCGSLCKPLVNYYALAILAPTSDSGRNCRACLSFANRTIEICIQVDFRPMYTIARFWVYAMSFRDRKCRFLIVQ